MTEPYLALAEIERRYPDEWVLLDRLRVDRRREVLGGHVLCHSADRVEFDRLLRAVAAGDHDPVMASVHTGEPVFPEVWDRPEFLVGDDEGGAMSTRYESMAEIERRYPNEWVLIDRPTDDRRTGRVAGGFVVMHSPDRAELDRRLIDEDEFPGVKLGAILFIGTTPDDAVVDLPPLAQVG